MDRLSEPQKVALIRAQVLLCGTPAAMALSDFERELVTGVAYRYAALGSACTTTPNEFQGVTDALHAMECWLRRNVCAVAQAQAEEASQAALRAA